MKFFISDKKNEVESGLIFPALEKLGALINSVLGIPGRLITDMHQLRKLYLQGIVGGVGEGKHILPHKLGIVVKILAIGRRHNQ